MKALVLLIIVKTLQPFNSYMLNLNVNPLIFTILFLLEYNTIFKLNQSVQM